MKIDWNYDALTEVRNNAEVVSQLGKLAEATLAKANATLKSGKGYVATHHTGPGTYNRHIVNIYPITEEAKKSNATLNTLAKIL